MTTRSVTHTLRHTDGSPWAGAVVTFRLQAGSYTPTDSYVPEAVSVTTAADGSFSQALWCNAEGLTAAKYACQLPNKSSFQFILPVGDGSAISLALLRAASGVQPAPAPIAALLDDLQAQINALGGSSGGPSGNTILSGSGVPSASLGIPGDYYLDTVAHRFYGPKASGAWGSGISVIGPQGATGPQGPIGGTGPKGDTGNTGPQGTPGTPGTQGPQGVAGPTGPKGDTGNTGPQGPAGSAGTGGTGGGAPLALTHRVYSTLDGNGAYWSVAPNGMVDELLHTELLRVHTDLTHATEIQLIIRAGSGDPFWKAYYTVQYSIDDGATWGFIDGGTSANNWFDGGGPRQPAVRQAPGEQWKVSPWTALTAAAKAQAILRVVSVASDEGHIPSVCSVQIGVR